MQRKGRGSFAFFITPRLVGSSEQAKASLATPMFTFAEESEVPYVLNVTLFGAMTLDECKMFAMLLNLKHGITMRVPRDIDHPRFHGDTITLPFTQMLKHLEKFFGNLKALPRGAILSMSAFFEYLRDEAVLDYQPNQKKSPTPD